MEKLPAYGEQLRNLPNYFPVLADIFFTICKTSLRSLSFKPDE